MADIEVRPAELVAADIEPELVPSLIDELPLLVLLASFARGTTTIRGAGELRVEGVRPDRHRGRALTRGGRHVEGARGRLRGAAACPRRLRGGDVDAAGDHRIAMLGAVAGVCSQEGVSVDGAESLAVSFPDFAERLAAVSS